MEKINYLILLSIVFLLFSCEDRYYIAENEDPDVLLFLQKTKKLPIDNIYAASFNNIMIRFAKLYHELVMYSYYDPNTDNYKKVLDIYDRLEGVSSVVIEEKNEFTFKNDIDDKTFSKYLLYFNRSLKALKNRYVNTFKRRTNNDTLWNNTNKEYWYLYFLKEKDYFINENNNLINSCIRCHKIYKGFE